MIGMIFDDIVIYSIAFWAPLGARFYVNSCHGSSGLCWKWNVELTQRRLIGRTEAYLLFGVSKNKRPGLSTRPFAF
ncbi:MAG: hypothetical protein U1E93_11955 [Alphaproteobacteria bacterium]